jgi:hypothetical protein
MYNVPAYEAIWLTMNASLAGRQATAMRVAAPYSVAASA